MLLYFRAFYDDSAFLRDADSRNILPNTAAGLHSILFALAIDSADLNTIAPARALDNLLSTASSLNRQPQQPSTTRQDLSPVIGGSDEAVKSSVRKKTKKAPVKIVSFDDGPSESASIVTVTSSARRRARHTRSGSSVSESKMAAASSAMSVGNDVTASHLTAQNDHPIANTREHSLKSSESTRDLSEVTCTSPHKGHRRGHSDTSMLSNFGSKLWKNLTSTTSAAAVNLKRKELQTVAIEKTQDDVTKSKQDVTSLENEEILGSSFGSNSFCGSLHSSDDVTSLGGNSVDATRDLPNHNDVHNIARSR